MVVGLIAVSLMYQENAAFSAAPERAMFRKLSGKWERSVLALVSPSVRCSIQDSIFFQRKSILKSIKFTVKNIKKLEQTQRCLNQFWNSSFIKKNLYEKGTFWLHVETKRIENVNIENTNLTYVSGFNIRCMYVCVFITTEYISAEMKLHFTLKIYIK